MDFVQNVGVDQVFEMLKWRTLDIPSWEHEPMIMEAHLVSIDLKYLVISLFSYFNPICINFLNKTLSLLCCFLLLERDKVIY